MRGGEIVDNFEKAAVEIGESKEPVDVQVNMLRSGLMSVNNNMLEIHSRVIAAMCECMGLAAENQVVIGTGAPYFITPQSPLPLSWKLEQPDNSTYSFWPIRLLPASSSISFRPIPL